MIIGEEIEWQVPKNYLKNFPEYFKEFLNKKNILYGRIERSNGIMLENGGIVYIDIPGELSILETSTPQCTNAYEILKYDKGFEQIVKSYFESRNETIDFSIMKHNTSYHRETENTYKLYGRGLHENYGIEENLINNLLKPDYKYLKNLLLMLLSRMLIVGSGGYMTDGNFVISPKALFGRYIDNQTTYGPTIYFYFYYKVPDVATSGHNKYIIRLKDKRRLEIRNSDSLIFEFPIFTKFLIGSKFLTAIINGYENLLYNITIPMEELLKEFIEISMDTEEYKWKVKIDNNNEIDLADYLNSKILYAIEKVGVEKKEKNGFNHLKYVVNKLMERDVENLQEYLEWVSIRKIIDRLGLSNIDKAILRPSFSDFGMFHERLTKKLLNGDFGIRPIRLLPENFNYLEVLKTPPQNSPSTARSYVLKRAYKEGKDLSNITFHWDKITYSYYGREDYREIPLKFSYTKEELKKLYEKLFS